MKNSEAVKTFHVLSQLNDVKGLPIKFAYGLVKLLSCLEKVNKMLHTAKNAHIQGQAAYDTERTALLVKSSDKDDVGKPIIIDNGRGGWNYKIDDMTTFEGKLKKLNEEHEEFLDALTFRNTEIEELLDTEVKDLDPYRINVVYLPVDKDGCSRITPSQLTHLLPFLDGGIEHIPDCKVA